MKVMVIPIVIGVLSTVTKGLVEELEDLEIRGWVETIQTTVLIVWEESWRLETCCHSDSLEKLSANVGMKKSQKRKIISKCWKQAEKDYKSRYDWVNMVIDQKLCKRLV